MKKLLTFLSLPLFLIACDDNSSSNPDYESICSDICTKESECSVLDGTIEECEAECLDFSKNMLDDFIEAIGECTMEKTCEELDSGDEFSDICYQESVESCTTDVESYVETACLKILECNGNDDPTAQELEQCEGQLHGDGNIFICFTQETINSVEDCITNSTSCNPNPVNICVEDILGIDMGNSGN